MSQNTGAHNHYFQIMIHVQLMATTGMQDMTLSHQARIDATPWRWNDLDTDKKLTLYKQLSTIIGGNAWIQLPPSLISS